MTTIDRATAALWLRRAGLTLLFLLAVNALNTWSTPEECRGVRPQEWSDSCKNVMLN